MASVKVYSFKVVKKGSAEFAVTLEGFEQASSRVITNYVLSVFDPTVDEISNM